jgi:hypothetical protein
LYDSLEVLAYDHFPASSVLRQLYESEALLEFIRACLGVEQLYRYADPFGALNVSIMRDGDVLDWHFDMTDFVVSIALQSSSHGGDFENASRIRDAGEEAIAELLSGDRRRVRVAIVVVQRVDLAELPLAQSSEEVCRRRQRNSRHRPPPRWSR